MQTAIAPNTAAPGPAISLVPPPTIEQQIEALSKERDSLLSKNRALVEDGAALLAKLKLLEKNPLTFALGNLDAGQVLGDAGKALRELADTVRDRQKKGRFTLIIDVKPFQNEALVFVPEIKITAPKPEASQSIFFTDGEGGLSRSNADQKEFADFKGTREDRALAAERRDPNSR